MGTPPPLPEPVRGLRLEERAPSITTLIVEASKTVSSSSVGPVCTSDLFSAMPADLAGLQPARFAGFPADAPNVPARPHASPFAVVTRDDELSCGAGGSPSMAEAADVPPIRQQAGQQSESIRSPIPPISPFESGHASCLIGSTFGSASAQGVIDAQGKCRLKQQSESAADFNSRKLQEPIGAHQWSPSSFQGHWERSDAASPRISDPSALALPLSAPSPLSDIPAVGGASRRLLADLALPLPSPAAAEELPPRVRQRLQSMIPEVLRGLFPALLPKLMPAALTAALPAASSVLASGNNNNINTAVDSLSAVESLLPVVLEAALTPALATALPKAVLATLNLLFSVACIGASNEEQHLPAAAPVPATASSGGSGTSTSAPPSLCSEPAAVAAVGAAAVTANAAHAATGERQQSMSLEQQSAAEAQLVRMLFGVDGNEPSLQQQHKETGNAKAAAPCVLDVAAAIASSVSSHGSGRASRVGSPTGSGISSPAEQLGPRPPSSAKLAVEGAAVAAAQDNLEHAAVASSEAAAAVPVSAVRRPSLAAFADASTGGAAPLSATGGDSYSRRLSETNHGGSAAPAAASRPASHFPAGSVKVPGQGSGAAGVSQQQLLYSRSSGGSGGGGSMGHGEDGMSSSVEDALSTCSGGDMPSPYSDICAGLGSALGTGANPNSSAVNSFLMHRGNSADSAAVAAGLYGISGDTLLDRLQHVHQSQHGAAPSSAASGPAGHIALPAELLMAASRKGGAAGAGAVGGVLASQLVQQTQSSQAAVAAALFMQQQQQQRQQQQEAEAAVAAQQQLQQLQQLQALVVGRSLSEQDLVPPSPPLSTTAAAGGVQWRRSSGTDVAFGGDLWQADAEALGFAAAAQLALGQQQQQQQQQAIAAAGLLQQQQQQQQQQLIAQSLAAVAAVNAAGRAVRAEDFLAFGTSGTSGLQLQAAAGLGSQAAAAQLAAAAAAAAGGAGPSATDLASYMDTALRRMLLVSPQVASELARACGAFSGAHAQLHHLCGIIAEQLLDVAAMAPEVAAALLRALAVHRTRGAQATDVDPRVMGRILQLLRAGPAGRQLCLVSLEQWVDGLSRIHKRRAYLDTILHNYQLTLKRLVQAMGHQVHAVNMSLPRQLLNDLSPRALLLLTAELAPYPLLQPRRWSEEIIWAVTQMHAMGIDMPTAGVSHGGAAAVAGQASTPTSAFQWEIRLALAATADDIVTAGGTAAACGHSPPGAGGAGPLAGMGLGGGGAASAAAAAGQVVGSSGATTPGGAAVPWAAHAALHRHLLLGLRRVQSRFFSDRLRKMHGLYGEPVEALLRSSLPQDVLVPEREVVVLVAVLLMLECRMRPEDFDAAFGRDLQRCLAVSSVEEVANRLRCGLVADSPLRLDPHKSRALSQLLKLGALPGQPQF